MSRNMLALCGTLLIVACGTPTEARGRAASYKTYSLAQAADSIPVRFGETVRVDGALLTFVSLVSDTRCAAQAQCVAPGDAEIEVIADPACLPQCRMPSFALRLHMYGPSRAGVYYGQRITLTWLLPLPLTPTSKPDPREYVAWLKVEPVS